MKIAFVANTCWNIYNFRKGLVHHFAAKGDEIIVLAPKDEYTEQVENWGAKCIHTPLEGTGTNPLKDVGYLKRLNSIFRSEKPDVILSFTIKSNIYACIAGKFNRIPVICNVSGLGTVFLVKGIAGKMAMTLYRFAFRFSKHIFFQNADDKQLFRSMVRIDDKRTSILPGSGIDLRHFKFTPLPNNDQTKFVMISRVIIEKGVREYAEVAASFSKDESVSFTLVGKFDAQHARSIKKEELDHWISSGWIEYKSHSDKIKDIITSHDAVILPSYREGTSRTLLEGAAMGRPLLTSNVPGCRDVVKDGYNGFIFEVKNSKNIVDKLKLFLSLSQEERQQMATNSRTLVEETYDERIIIDKYTNAIHRIIK